MTAIMPSRDCGHRGQSQDATGRRWRLGPSPLFAQLKTVFRCSTGSLLNGRGFGFTTPESQAANEDICIGRIYGEMLIAFKHDDRVFRNGDKCRDPSRRVQG